jgi:hypothetical protein
MKIINSKLEISDSVSGKSVIGNLLRKNGLIEDFAQIGFTTDDYSWLVESVNSERMSNNPVNFSKAELFQILVS